MLFKGVVALLFLTNFALGFSKCPKSRHALSDISIYNDQDVQDFRSLFGVSRDDVGFRLWTRSHTDEFTPLYIDHLASEHEIRPQLPFKFIIHGWTDCANSEWYDHLKEEYLKKDDYNVILVDWRKPAGAIYPLSAGYVDDVGNIVGELIMDLHNTWNVSFANIHLVGHSLGAHISGFAGKYIQEHASEKIGRITGLDPAGPLFLLTAAKNRLNDEDASFVDIIHTDGGKFGYFGIMGHVDFYPNGGYAPQTGCVLFGLSDVASCSHIRVYWLFGESINSEEFVAVECDTFSHFKNGNCAENAKALMGENTDVNLKGVYYLNTNGAQPFAKNGEM